MNMNGFLSKPEQYKSARTSSFASNSTEFGFACRVLFVLLITLSSSLSAQQSKEPRLSSEPLNLIDLPTAGMLYDRNFSTSLEFLDEGGMSVNVQAGFFNRVMVGIAYGGTGIVGVQKADLNPHIGALVRFRAFEESYYVPAIAIGFSSQGKGAFIDSLNRYTTKSPGFYAVASKNFDALGDFSIHFGTHYSLEDAGHRTYNFYGGLEKTFASIFSGMLEYDNGFSIENSSKTDRGKGMLNLGIRAMIGNGFLLGVNLKDLVRNRQEVSIGDRTIQISYARTF